MHCIHTLHLLLYWLLCVIPVVTTFQLAVCRVAREVLNTAGEAVRCGVTTDEIDAIAHNACIAAGAYPSPLCYRGFPKSICTSVNNVACHGIPDDRPLCDGDIVNVDVTVSIYYLATELNTDFLIFIRQFIISAIG